MLEPAALGVPVITGPSYYNFKEIAIALEKENGIAVVENTQLGLKTQQLLNNREQQNLMAETALKVVQKNQGALAMTLSVCME